MRTFLINLDKSTERLASARFQLERNSIPFERVSAVMGAALDKRERMEKYDSIRALLANGKPLRDGEIGCSLSHCLVYKKMVEEGIDVALILEDDIVLGKEFADVVKAVGSWIDPRRKQVVLISAHGVERRQPGIYPIMGGMCTDAYVITRLAAEAIYKSNYPVVVQADRWRRWQKRFGVEMYRIFPTTVVQDNERFGTEISDWEEQSRIKNARRTLLRFFLGKALRATECFIDWCWWKVSGK